MHESTLYEDNLFLTLTYAPENLPADGSLNKRHWQLFMKRLKKAYGGKSLRFFHCGEYGDETDRPHYHAILFNHTFDDLKFLKETDAGFRIYTSEKLDHIWSLGDCYIGNVTFESAAYCARYVMKKRNGKMAETHYNGRIQEYSTQSRRPGLGKPWLEKWKTDVYPNDFIVMNGQKLKPPKYYDKLVKSEDLFNVVIIEGLPTYYPVVKLTETDVRTGSRIRSAAKHSSNNTPDRLAVREECHERRIERLTRKHI